MTDTSKLGFIETLANLPLLTLEQRSIINHLAEGGTWEDYTQGGKRGFLIPYQAYDAVVLDTPIDVYGHGLYELLFERADLSTEERELIAHLVAGGTWTDFVNRVMRADNSFGRSWHTFQLYDTIVLRHRQDLAAAV